MPPILEMIYLFVKPFVRAYNDLDGFWGIGPIYKPVENGNNLLNKLSENDLKVFFKKFENLVDDGKRAVNETDIKNSAKIWSEHFDERFISV
jgi:hypothetical protein